VRVLSILKEDGSLAKDLEPPLKDDDLRRIFRTMLLVRTLDERCMNLQRQGRLAFYGTATGEEAAVIGSGYALRPDDMVFPALRQGGVLLLRGFPLERYFAHLFGNAEAVEKGRSMPCHYSDRTYHVFSWSSSMATQLPHAVGWAYGEKLASTGGSGSGAGGGRVAMAYLGDGATSEGDFHVAANFAAVWKTPTVFFCNNNQWAISVPFAKQSVVGVAEKAKAYGFPGVRVDGNDVLACYAATKEAADRARRGEGPTLIEAVTYRMGPHSTSDDPTRYCPKDELDAWAKKDPILRFKEHLAKAGLWTPEWEAEIRKKAEDEVQAAIAAAEATGPPAPDTLFGDVFDKLSPQLETQRETMRRLVDEFGIPGGHGAEPKKGGH